MRKHHLLWLGIASLLAWATPVFAIDNMAGKGAAAQDSGMKKEAIKGMASPSDHAGKMDKMDKTGQLPDKAAYPPNKWSKGGQFPGKSAHGGKKGSFPSKSGYWGK